ncbi:uncharacterized protein LOC120913694 isoform X2 [Rana temporaria]|uniref:uncharacterized protein LOC120913694 isoform X2 n=1 Tax=Rana temporaria TaxID=8407 RepID=UPI001AAD82CE|nr:uncharacterized protein LOC120913694 isoform X2 [Rana temporaria]
MFEEGGGGELPPNLYLLPASAVKEPKIPSALKRRRNLWRHWIKDIYRKVFGWPVHCINVWMKYIIGGLMDSEKIEPKNITYEECKKTSVKGEASARRGMEFEDTVDFSVDDPVLQALEGVSGAIYKKCFSNWHCPPEEMKDQPLFKEINAGIRGIYNNIKATVRPLEEYEILIAITNALITHLKNFRKKRMTYRYNTDQEEADFLRKQIKCLLLYWLPDSLRNSDHILVFLNEILSINVLRPSINNLADSTFINEMIVRNLASEEVLVKDALKESGAFSENDSNIPVYTSDSIPHRKEKKGFKGKLKAMAHRLKRNKSEGCSTFRSFPSIGEDTMDSTEDTMDSTEEDTMDSTEELCESGGDDLLSSIIDAGLQKWLQENWTAKIYESPTQDRNIYKIGVYEEGSLNANLWITERSVEDFRQIYSIICRDYQDLNIFPYLEGSEIEEDRHFFQAIGIDPDTFIHKLLELIKLYQKSEPIFFFSPFNYEEKGTELFSRAFSDNDLSPEDNLAVKSETEDTFHESTDDPEGCYESDGFKAFQWKKKAKNKKSKDGSGNELEDTSAILFSSEDHALPMLEREDTVHHNTDRKKQGFNKVTQGDSTKSSTDPLSVPADEPSTNSSKAIPYLEEEKNKQRKKLEEEFLDALYCLADELFAGGKFIIRFIRHTGIFKEKNKALLAAIPKLYTEDQIVWYLNKTSELLLADVIPLPVPPDELPSKAQEILKSKVQSLLTYTCIKYLFERKILRDTEAAYEVFQKSKANKETLFRILEDLTRILTNASQETIRY